MKQETFTYSKLLEYHDILSSLFILNKNNITCYECKLPFLNNKFTKVVGSHNNLEPAYFFERKRGILPNMTATIYAVFCSCICATKFQFREGDNYEEYWNRNYN